MATGYLIDNTVFYLTPNQPALALVTVSEVTDAIIDCLLYAGNPVPTPAALPTWFPNYVNVMNQLGWVTTATTTVTAPLVSAGQASAKGMGVPWLSIRDQLKPTSSPSVISALGGLVTKLATLSGPGLQHWNTHSLAGTAGIAVIAIAEINGATCQMSLVAASLTYPSSAHPARLAAYPSRPATAAGSSLTIDTVTVQMNLDQLLQLTGKLDPLVAAVRQAVITVTA
ncbi:hypothetical protein [Curtobacterium sp. VKM Ac-1393]|uniref:hypothetical protein n=1 Tax=Curtobacterium sp. VKM Ac-1393 TaxID=2783814 RepID=UPI00188D82B6|nr:hypothetical protein [Curtobacterium sp. VKM Ac-1393]MBF4609386.1 hypothetical protein [Curtobacterium sp. VKM Ac-1393]